MIRLFKVCLRPFNPTLSISKVQLGIMPKKPDRALGSTIKRGKLQPNSNAHCQEERVCAADWGLHQMTLFSA